MQTWVLTGKTVYRIFMTELNPLQESAKARQVDPCVLVIFGATGDLTARKLMPALYNLAREGQLPTHFACVGFARREKTDGQFREEMHQHVSEHSRELPIDDSVWNGFSEHVFYHESPFDHSDGYAKLKTRLEEIDQKCGTKGNRVYYLATQPDHFTLIIEQLKNQGLIYGPEEQECFSRVIIEKPFGHDLNSAIELQKNLTNHLSEKQIYRIDHYLGKETTQNILVFRFANSIFESLWNSQHIEQVQITVAEDIGIGSRGALWEKQGLVRDILQNHMMQLLTLMAMEPPVNLSAESVRDEKVKVLEAIRPLEGDDFKNWVVRGQYGPGLVNGEDVKGYREEENVDPNSQVESYAAVRFYIDNWRWDGVPFYLRGAKRMPKRCTEISIQFKDAPGHLFSDGQSLENNVLTIRIQPNEGIALKMNSKVPGTASPIQPVKMDFRYSAFFGMTPPDAYERLICDCMAGDTTLFAREDEVFNSWKLMTPILEYWQANPIDFPNYAAGSWGPDAADQMLAKNGHQWRRI